MSTRIKEVNYDDFIWIDICNPEKTNLDKIAKEYNLDYFQIIDSQQTGHLPKFEKQEKYNFLILRAYTSNNDERPTNITELSNKIAFFYSGKKVITIHRAEFGFLNNITKSFTKSEDLLLYLIYKMLETFEEPSKILSDKNDEIEQTVFLKDYTKISLEDLYYQKTQTRITKKLLLITQNVINQIEVNENSKTALQDIKDKLLSLVLHYDEILENSTNLLSTYLSVNAQKNNDVIKLLTIFSAFFLPLTFLAGIYGMNFDIMPELKMEYGYYLILGVMIATAITIFIWFKKKRIL
ncbi:MAG: CorA family divalent cation transporter [Ignavibacteria bacterium]